MFWLIPWFPVSTAILLLGAVLAGLQMNGLAIACLALGAVAMVLGAIQWMQGQIHLGNVVSWDRRWFKANDLIQLAHGIEKILDEGLPFHETFDRMSQHYKENNDLLRDVNSFLGRHGDRCGVDKNTRNRIAIRETNESELLVRHGALLRAAWLVCPRYWRKHLGISPRD